MKKSLWARFTVLVNIQSYVLVLLAMAASVYAYDVNGDGKEGLPEAIHALQVTAGLSPFSSTVVFVGPVGTPAENGTALINALNTITDAGSTKPYLLKIEPGIYDLGNNGLTMKAYVDMEGSGENTTRITSSHSSGSANASSATIIGANSTEIRFLTVKNTGVSGYSIALYNSSASPKLTNITATASGGSFSFGVYNYSSSPFMTNVTITASSSTSANYGVFNHSSSPSMTNLTITAAGGNYTYGVYNESSSSPAMTNVTAIASEGFSVDYGIVNASSSSPIIRGSVLSSGLYSIYNVNATARVGSTMLKGIVGGTGFTCVGAYTASFVALNAGCL